MTDEQYQHLFLRLSELERIREIARGDGEPAEMLGEIRGVLGVETSHFGETGHATTEAGRRERAAA